ncbi:MAG: MBL fold metallo-hydrolase [Phycisphaerae bacterium]
MAERLFEHELSGIRIVGHSLAGEESVVAVPELNVCFDAGKAPAAFLAIDHLLLTHGHMDHAAGVAYYLSQRNFVGNSPGTIVCPKPLVEPLRDLLRVWGRLEGHVTPANIVGLEPGQEHEIRKGLVARSFAVNHRVPALGYAIVDVRRKLRPEFADRTGPQLVELKKQGVEIQYSVEVPLVTYCGDTAEGEFLNLEPVRRARVLVIECTFFEEDHVRRAREGYHLHVRDLARILPKLENEWVLVTHLTRRTALREARRTLGKMVDADRLARVRFLHEGRRFDSHARPAGAGAAGPAREPAAPMDDDEG